MWQLMQPYVNQQIALFGLDRNVESGPSNAAGTIKLCSELVWSSEAEVGGREIEFD